MLRDYQLSAVADLHKSFANKENTLIQLPTGTGKTTVIAQYLKEWRNQNQNKRALVVAHRVELIDQIVERLFQFGINAGKILSSEPLSENHQIQVGLIQSLRNDRRKPISLGLIIVDEAHHINAQSYTDLIEYYRVYNPLVFGFTATPSRLDGRSLGDIFMKLHEYGQINKFIEMGYLSPLKHYATGFPDVKIIKVKSTGDYDEKSLEKEMSKEKVMADLITGYEMHARNKKMIVFAVNSDHATNIAKRYNQSGYSAVSLDYKTPTEIRKNSLSEFKVGKIKILVNVNLFTEGFDCPDVEVVQLARPTKSLNLYLQMVGRGMRISPGKEFGIILDNAMLWEEHGLSTTNREWNLLGLVENKLKYLITENRDISENKQSEPRVPKESSFFELIEIEQLDSGCDFEQIISLLALPICIKELNVILNFFSVFNNNGRISNENLSNFNFTHYLADKQLNLYDVLEIIGIKLNKNQKTYSAKNILNQIQEFVDCISDFSHWNKRHVAYLYIFYWSSFGFFKIRNPSIKVDALGVMKNEDILKLLKFFKDEMVFDDLIDDKSIILNGLEKIDISYIHRILDKIKEKYAIEIMEKLKMFSV